MQEIWKDIEGYPNYQISNLGNVKSLNYKRTGKDKFLKLVKLKCGYLSVIFHKEGKVKLNYIHRLVAQAFIPNPNKYLEVNHKDEQKTNNCVSNLEWCDRKYNVNFGTRSERVGKAISKANKGLKRTQETKDKISAAHKGKKQPQEQIEKRVKAISKPILQLTKDGDFIRQWESAKQAERELNINQGNIIKCCKGKRKTAYGCHWKYV